MNEETGYRFSENGTKWEDGGDLIWPVKPEEGVTRLVIGSLEKEKEIELEADGALLRKLADGGLKEAYPDLKCLHLWGIKNLQKLGALPGGLEELDVQNCGQLEEVGDLPQGLTLLVLRECPELARLPEVAEDGFAKLEELELNGGARIPEAWIQVAVAESLLLWKFNGSACTQIRSIKRWSGSLRDIRLAGCGQLTTLPRNWPPELKRLEVSDSKVESLPKFVAGMDYVNLAGIKKLQKIDLGKARPRTLILFGSGVRIPPAAMHGSSPDDNAAPAWREYSEMKALTGEGDVHSCKVMFLGNGTAGKTCLSLALDPRVGDPIEQAKVLGSTHGVQFRPLSAELVVNGQASRVSLQHWDFGGQELYHGTHRLFMGTGAVFVVVWRPEQEGRRPGRCDTTGYEDTWRPLSYWLDFIRQAAGSTDPEIVVVCPERSEISATTREIFEAHSKAGQEIELLAVESANRDCPGLSKLRDWVEQAAVGVVEAEGSEVPSFWEIADRLVEGWTRDGGHDEMSVDAFRQELDASVRRAVQPEVDKQRRFAELKAALDDGFQLDTSHVQWVLRFLTNIGALYWDEKLFGERVIVGQQWALDGVYSVLNRKADTGGGKVEETHVYKKLAERAGRFTRSDLQDWVWRDRYSEEQQRLLISFMVKCGVCFPLVKEEESWREETVYVSLHHLADSKTLGMEADFNARFGLESSKFERGTPPENPFLHEGHWHQLLAKLGEKYGKAAQYARDGFYLPSNKDGQSVFIEVKWNERELGGTIYLDVAGGEREELRKEMRAALNELLPDPVTGRYQKRDGKFFELVGEPTKPRRVFVSYAHPSGAKVADGTENLERPVEFLARQLEESKAYVELIWDKGNLMTGQLLVKFMREQACLADKVLIVCSEKYWKSQYCMYEATEAVEGIVQRNQSIGETLCALCLGGDGPPPSQEAKDYWSQFSEDDFDEELGGPDGTTHARLKRWVEGFFDDRLPNLIGTAHTRWTWDESRPEETVKWLLDLLDLEYRPVEP